VSETLSNYENRDQLPLFGLVYSEADNEYEYLMAGMKVSRENHPHWEDPEPSDTESVVYQ
jgi:hypothetical protein